MFTLDADSDDEKHSLNSSIDWAILEQMFEDNSDVIEQLMTTGMVKGVVTIDGVDFDYIMIVDDGEDDQNEFDFPDFPPDY